MPNVASELKVTRTYYAYVVKIPFIYKIAMLADRMVMSSIYMKVSHCIYGTCDT